MRQLIAIAVVGLITTSASSAYAQCASCGAPSYSPVYSAPSYSTPVRSYNYGPSYSSGISRSYGSACPGGNCGFGGGMYGGGGGCVGGNCGHGGVHGVANKLWQLEKRKNYWLLAKFGLR